MISQSNQVFPAFAFTATGTSPVVQLSPSQSGANGAYSAGVFTVGGVGLTSATFAVQGSADGGQNYFPLNVAAVSSPGTLNLSTTATGAGMYIVDLAGITHVRVQTTALTATSLSIQLTTSPNGSVLPLSGGSGGGGGGAVSSVFGRTGAVTAQTNDYSFSQISGTATPTQLPVATTGANGVVRPDGTTITITGGVISSSGGGAVSSVFGRTGAVVAATNDYSFSQISGTASTAQVPWATPGTIGSTTPNTGAFTSMAFTSEVITGTGAASFSPVVYTGTVFTGGTGTTTFPFALFDFGATKPTSWGTNGTILGFNAPSGWVGNFIDLHVNGAGSIFAISQSGNITAAGINAGTYRNVAGTISLTLSATSSLNSGFQSTFLASTSESPAASATPTFSATIGLTKYTMGQNVTSSTLAAGTDGELKTFDIIQNATTAFTFTWPTNVRGGMTIGTTLGGHNVQSFVYNSTAALWYATSSGVTNQ